MAVINFVIMFDSLLTYGLFLCEGFFWNYISVLFISVYKRCSIC